MWPQTSQKLNFLRTSHGHGPARPSKSYGPVTTRIMPQSHETTAAVRSYISTSRNSSAAAVFLRLHTLAVTLATARRPYGAFLILIPQYGAFLIFNTSVTFATAAVRSYISTISSNSTAAAVFLRLYTRAVTFATAAIRRIFNLWRQKNCGCPMSFEVMTHGRRRAFLPQP